MFRMNVLGQIRVHKWAAGDIESKRRGSQDAGFDDPFKMGFDDGVSAIVFNNEVRCLAHPHEERAYVPGGCVREYLEHVLQAKYSYDTHKGGGGWIHVFHNGGNFDFNHLLIALERMVDRFTYDVIVNGGKIISITVKSRWGKRKLKWKFWDSSLPASLADFGKTIGVEKMEHDLDMHSSDPRWDKYVLQDCRVLRLVMERFQSIANGLGAQWKPTLPGTVIDLFRRLASEAKDDGINLAIRRNRHFQDCPDLCAKCGRIVCSKNCSQKIVRDEEIAHWRWDPKIQCHRGMCPWSPDGCAHFFFRRAFFGGRTEMFEQTAEFESIAAEAKKLSAMIGIDIEPFFGTFDINSSYPASMLAAMPVGRMFSMLGKRSFDRIWSEVLIGKEKRAGFIECTVYVPPMPYPPLPIRKDGKVIFACGYIQGVWTSEELKLACSLGVQIREVNRHVWIVRLPVFRYMINKLWDMRKDALASHEIDPKAGWKATAEILKLFMNSFFGKWGMGEYRDDFVADDGDGLPSGAVPFDETRHGKRIKHVEEDYINPHIAAWITSLSRIRLLTGILQVHRLNDGLPFPYFRVWYTDTDSLKTNAQIASSTDLGAWKQEFPERDKHGEPTMTFVRARYDTAKVYEEQWAGTCPKGCSHRKKGKPCGRKLHVIVKSKGIQEPDAEKIKRLRAGESIYQRATPKFRQLVRKGFRSYDTRYDAKKSMTMRYDKRILDAEGRTKPQFIEIDQVIHEGRAVLSDNLRRWDAQQVSVRAREEQWRGGTKDDQRKAG